jgi:hypothetical protein
VARPEVAVIGGGLAGLTAALHLAERGVPTLLLEADTRYAGGRCWGGAHFSNETAHSENALGVRVGNHTFYPEHGMHGLWNEYHHFRATLERFGIAPELFIAQEEEWIHGEGPRVRRVEIGSAIREAGLPAPLHYLELFTRPGFLRYMSLRDWTALLPVWYSLLFAIALDPFARSLPLTGQSLNTFFRGWTPRLAALFRGLARCGPSEDSLAGFIAFLRFYTLLRRDAWRFSYLTTDPGEALINPLVDAFRARDGVLQLGALVEEIDRPSDANTRWKIRYQTTSGARTFYADQLILALDPPAAQRLLTESPFTRPIAADYQWPRGLANGVVRAWFNVAPRPGPEAGMFTGDFVADNFFWLQRIRRDFAEWGRATGGSAVEMHLYGPPEFLDQPEAVILGRAVSDVYRAFPELRGHLIAQTFQHNGQSHTSVMVAPADRWLGVATPWPNLWACGDWVRGEWPALFIERACVSALAAANGVLEAAGLAPYPLIPYSPPEPFAAWLQQALLGGRAIVRRWRRLT